MTDSAAPSMPPGWMTESQARKLIGGELGNAYRRILSTSCAPLCWFARDKRPDLDTMKNGTATIAHTGERLIGITAAHVIEEFVRDEIMTPQTVMLMNASLPTLSIIDINSRLDTATFEIDAVTISQIGKDITPLAVWPPQPPTEGRGILIGGYPRISRKPKTLDGEMASMEWGLLTILGIACRVTEEQIAWMVDHDSDVPHPTIPAPPPRAELGGISGGPVITLLDRNGIHYWGLAGIVSQASAELERVVARRADYIRANGRIGRIII